MVHWFFVSFKPWSISHHYWILYHPLSSILRLYMKFSPKNFNRYYKRNNIREFTCLLLNCQLEKKSFLISSRTLYIYSCCFLSTLFIIMYTSLTPYYILIVWADTINPFRSPHWKNSQLLITYQYGCHCSLPFCLAFYKHTRTEILSDCIAILLRVYDDVVYLRVMHSQVIETTSTFICHTHQFSRHRIFFHILSCWNYHLFHW